jgi:hypothetical protein
MLRGPRFDRFRDEDNQGPARIEEEAARRRSFHWKVTTEVFEQIE